MFGWYEDTSGWPYQEAEEKSTDAPKYVVAPLSAMPDFSVSYTEFDESVKKMMNQPVLTVKDPKTVDEVFDEAIQLMQKYNYYYND